MKNWIDAAMYRLTIIILSAMAFYMAYLCMIERIK